MQAKILLVLFICFFAESCKKDDPVEDDGPSYVTIDYPFYFGTPQDEPIDNRTTKEGVKLGRFLFYEKMLSIDTTVSCASCHQQAQAFSDPAQFSTGVNGLTTRNSMSLSNLNWHTKFFWDGRASSLEEQALIPIQDATEMNLTLTEAEERLAATELYPQLFFKAFGSTKITAERIGKAIAQFERTLVSGESKYDLYKKGLVEFSADEIKGEQLFFTHPEPSQGLRGGNCGDCHVGALQKSNVFRNNGSDPTHSDAGLENVTGNDNDKGKMKTVSLRNITLTAPYMHDGRFATLEDVLDHYNEHVDFDDQRVDFLIRGVSNTPFAQTLDLTDTEKDQIIAFLKTLTDSTFINNDEFSDPFE